MKNPFIRFLSRIIFSGILILFAVSLFLYSNINFNFLDIFAFLIIFVFLFIFGFGIFDVFAPNILIEYNYLNPVIIAICLISTFIIIGVNKRVDIDTCRKDLQEIFSIPFENVEIDSCKDDADMGSYVLYAEIIGNQTFFNRLLDLYDFSPHESIVYYPTNFNIHSKIMSDSLNLVHKDWGNYNNGGGFEKIIGCHSETFNCSFYHLSIDG